MPTIVRCGCVCVHYIHTKKLRSICFNFSGIIFYYILSDNRYFETSLLTKLQEKYYSTYMGKYNICMYKYKYCYI